MVPIIGITLGLSIPIVYAIIDYRKRRRLMELHHAERMASIERGMDPAPWTLDVLGPAPRRRPQSTLLPGLIWLFVGVGLVFALRAAPDEDMSHMALFGLIPAGVGVAYLIQWLVEGRMEKLNGLPPVNGVPPR
jgi:hypothetical protein